MSVNWGTWKGFPETLLAAAAALFAVDGDELIVVGDEEANGVARPDALQASPVNVGDHGIDVIQGRNRSGRSAVPVDPDPLTQTNVVTSPYEFVSDIPYFHIFIGE